MPHPFQLGIEGKGAVLQAGDQQGNEERHNDGNIVKAHVDLQTVLEQQPQPQINDKKYPDGQQGNGITLFHSFSSLVIVKAGDGGGKISRQSEGLPTDKQEDNCDTDNI